MPLWHLEQTSPWMPPPKDSVHNSRVKALVVRADTEGQARLVASSYGMPVGEFVKKPGQAAKTIYSPFLEEDASTCV